MLGLYLYLSGNWDFGGSIMWQNYSLNCYQLLSPVAILCFHVFILPKSAFCFKRRGHRGLYMVSRPYCFPQWPHHFTFPSTEHERSSCPTSLLTLVIFQLSIVVILMGVVHWFLLKSYVFAAWFQSSQALLRCQPGWKRRAADGLCRDFQSGHWSGPW